MAKVLYVVAQPDGGSEAYTSLKELAKVFNVDKITRKDIEAGNYPVEMMDEDSYKQLHIDVHGIPSLVNEDIPEDIRAEIDESIDEDNLDHHTQYGDDAVDNPELDDVRDLTQDEIDESNMYNGDHNEDDTTDTPDEDTSALTNTPNGKRQVLADQEVEYPEVGHFDTEKALKKFYKKLSDDQLDEWLELEGLEYKGCEHPAINRMRKCMAILEHHFPKQPKTKASKKSKYADYSTEQLVQLAKEHNIEVKDSKGSDQILRMYTIMALREAKVIS